MILSTNISGNIKGFQNKSKKKSKYEYDVSDCTVARIPIERFTVTKKLETRLWIRARHRPLRHKKSNENLSSALCQSPRLPLSPLIPSVYHLDSSFAFGSPIYLQNLPTYPCIS